MWDMDFLQGEAEVTLGSSMCVTWIFFRGRQGVCDMDTCAQGEAEVRQSGALGVSFQIFAWKT